MGSGQPFRQEKENAVSGARGTGTAKFSNQAAAAPAAPAGRDPATTPPYSKLRMRDRYDGKEMEELAGASATFAAHMALLRDNGAEVEYLVAPLPKAAGGGRTVPYVGFRRYDMTIDQKTILPGFHVFDVFLHEHGHVAEYAETAFVGPVPPGYYLRFMHAVQAELGLRLSPDSHDVPLPGSGK